jgi:hypothetical protein
MGGFSNAVLANRERQVNSVKPEETIDNLIRFTLSIVRYYLTISFFKTYTQTQKRKFYQHRDINWLSFNDRSCKKRDTSNPLMSVSCLLLFFHQIWMNISGYARLRQLKRVDKNCVKKLCVKAFCLLRLLIKVQEQQHD